MTPYKWIEEALQALQYAWDKLEDGGAADMVRDTLHARPTQPLTVTEIKSILVEALDDPHEVDTIIRTLKTANALYVKE